MLLKGWLLKCVSDVIERMVEQLKTKISKIEMLFS
jgi:hypothetical protein